MKALLNIDVVSDAKKVLATVSREFDVDIDVFGLEPRATVVSLTQDSSIKLPVYIERYELENRRCILKAKKPINLSQLSEQNDLNAALNDIQKSGFDVICYSGLQREFEPHVSQPIYRLLTKSRATSFFVLSSLLLYFSAAWMLFHLSLSLHQ